MKVLVDFLLLHGTVEIQILSVVGTSCFFLRLSYRLIHSRRFLFAGHRERTLGAGGLLTAPSSRFFGSS